MSTQGQDHSLTFVEGHSDLINFKHFFQTARGRSKHPWEKKICLNGPDHKPKIADMPIYDKNI